MGNFTVWAIVISNWSDIMQRLRWMQSLPTQEHPHWSQMSITVYSTLDQRNFIEMMWEHHWCWVCIQWVAFQFHSPCNAELPRYGLNRALRHVTTSRRYCNSTSRMDGRTTNAVPHCTSTPALLPTDRHSASSWEVDWESPALDSIWNVTLFSGVY